MPSRMTELTLIFRRERIRWDETAILECEQPEDMAMIVAHDQPLAIGRQDVIVKATDCPEGELIAGLSYRFYGQWTDHERHGRQFVARTYVRCQPHGRAGVIRYLTTTCRGCGIGHATAVKLWDKFGSNACRILRESPDVAVAAVDLPHFNADKADQAAAVLREEAALEAVSIDLIDLLGGRGFPRDLARKAVGEWGNRAAVLVRHNPYLLMRFRGVGFLRTDQLYLDNGGQPAAVKRQALCAWYSLARDTEGHTWFRPQQIEAGLAARISGAAVDPAKAVKLANRGRLIACHRNGPGEPWFAEWRKAENEKTVAEHVRSMLGAPVQWPEVEGLG